MAVIASASQTLSESAAAQASSQDRPLAPIRQTTISGEFVAVTAMGKPARLAKRTENSATACITVLVVLLASSITVRL
jgi:hypothetical protein